MKTHERAFSLLELLVTLGVLTILTAAGLPELYRQIEDTRLRSVSTELLISAALARSTAITRGRPVLVRAINGSWSNGWSVFVDVDNDALQGEHEPSLVQFNDLKRINIYANSPVAKFIRFTPSGRTKMLGGAFQAGTLTLCHSSSDVKSRKLILTATGRMRVSQAIEGPC